MGERSRGLQQDVQQRDTPKRGCSVTCIFGSIWAFGLTYRRHVWLTSANEERRRKAELGIDKRIALALRST